MSPLQQEAEWAYQTALGKGLILPEDTAVLFHSWQAHHHPFADQFMNQRSVRAELAHIHHPHDPFFEFINDRKIIFDARFTSKYQIAYQGFPRMFCDEVADRLFAVHNMS